MLRRVEALSMWPHNWFLAPFLLHGAGMDKCMNWVAWICYVDFVRGVSSALQ